MSTSPVKIDAHVHIYPLYDANRFWTTAFSRLAGGAICLTERHDCRAFATLAQGEGLPEGYRCSPCDRGSVLEVSTPSGERIFVLAGRQINTAERLEILAMGCDAQIADGQPILETIEQVRAQGGFDVLGWSPGKWLFKREAIVRDLIENKQVQAVGDSTMRPIGWLTPRLVSRAKQLGLPVLCGTDPLPAVGEEGIVGRFGHQAVGFDPAKPGESLQAFLRNPGPRFGSRCGPIGVAARMKRMK